MIQKVIDFQGTWTNVCQAQGKDCYFRKVQLVRIIRAGIESRQSLVSKLIKAVGIGVLLIFFRVVLPVDKSFLFLFWNLFLAAIPLFIGIVLLHHAKSKKLYQVLPFLIIWLIFFPNAPYMLTDYRHLQGSYGLTFVIDFITILYFALIAFCMAVISLNDIRQILSVYMHRSLLIFVIIVICLLCGFGVFIGRDMRFNSWDLVSKPLEVISESVNGFFNFHSNYWTVLASGLISLLLILSMLVYKKKH